MDVTSVYKMLKARLQKAKTSNARERHLWQAANTELRLDSSVKHNLNFLSLGSDPTSSATANWTSLLLILRCNEIYVS